MYEKMRGAEQQVQSTCLAKSSRATYSSHIRQMERVLETVLGQPFTTWLPIHDKVDRKYIALYCLARKAEGARRAQVQQELRLWDELVLDL